MQWRRLSLDFGASGSGAMDIAGELKGSTSELAASSHDLDDSGGAGKDGEPESAPPSAGARKRMKRSKLLARARERRAVLRTKKHVVEKSTEKTSPV